MRILSIVNKIFFSLFIFIVFGFSAFMGSNLSAKIDVKLTGECGLEGLISWYMIPLILILEYVLFLMTKKNKYVLLIKRRLPFFDYLYVLIIAIVVSLFFGILTGFLIARI